MKKLLPTKQGASYQGSLEKRVLDVVVSGAALIFLSPVLIILYALLSLKGGAIYSHRRIGLEGRAFNCLKFRSMIRDSEVVLKKYLECNEVARNQWENEFKLNSDPRITPIGAFIRRTSLDETPQLLNVLRGDMTLVGPRPIVAKELNKYGRTKRIYLATKPGLTGLWQASGRSNVGYKRRVAMDRWYASNCSLKCDLQLILLTVRAVLLAKGAK